MSVRHPPENRVPPVSRRAPSIRSSRVVRYEEPESGFFRRWMRRIFSPPVLVLLVFLFTLTVGVLGYYYYVFSVRIDRLLRGEIFTHSAGIYAAPQELRVGENSSLDDLIARLKRAGYVEKAQQADSARGRYTLSGANLDVEPSGNAQVDGKSLFPNVRVSFARGGKSVVSIKDLGSNSPIIQLRFKSISKSPAACRIKPGWGFRHSHATR
jgi:penicillin-binding protein 1B